MPGSGSNAFRQSANRAHQQAVQGMHRRTQQRINDMMAQPRLRQSFGRSSPSDVTLDFSADEGVRRRRWTKLALALACLGLVLAGGIYLGLSGRSTAGGVDATVRSGSAWNLRAEPNARSQIVGRVQPGEQIIISCLAGGWAKLKAPREGVFINTRGLSYQKKPASC